MPTATPGELPPAMAAIPIEALEQLEKNTGLPFGKIIEEVSTGSYSIATMRELVRLVDPEAPIDTLGELIAAAQELIPKVASPAQA